MHFTTSIIAPFSFLVLSTNAAVLKRSDLHVADFRSFGAVGCDAENQGVWTFTKSQATGDCTSFSSFGADEVQAINLTDIKSGCSLELFPDDSCNELPKSLNVGECTSGERKFESFRLGCKAEE